MKPQAVILHLIRIAPLAALALIAVSGLAAAGPSGEEFSVQGYGVERELDRAVPGLSCVRELGLPALTVALGLVDGFNPCAFFVLLFLMSLMAHARSRGRMALVGGVFVFFSGLMYFVFMAAWLNAFLLIGMSRAITSSAGVVALVLAGINIKDFFLFRKGVSLGIPESAKPGLFGRMRGLLGAASTVSLLAGTLTLALAANMYELLCTAGIPMVYTRILTMQDISGASYYGYLALYNAVYVLPLAFIVAVSIKTLGGRKLTGRQGRILKLLSGNMMLVMGGALLVRPALVASAPSAILVLAASLAVTGIVVVIYERYGGHAGEHT